MASLKKSEWSFLLPLVSLIITFLVIAKSSSFRSLSLEIQKDPPFISVEVGGCVYRPGIYEVEEGSFLGEAVKKARPKPLADLGEIDLMQTVECSCKIEVPAYKEICVEIRGCVEKEMRLTLPAGSRICDLKKLVVLSEGADQACLQSRKILRNLDVLVIPSQKNHNPNYFSGLRRLVEGSSRISLSENLKLAILSVYHRCELQFFKMDTTAGRKNDNETAWTEKRNGPNL